MKIILTKREMESIKGTALNITRQINSVNEMTGNRIISLPENITDKDILYFNQDYEKIVRIEHHIGDGRYGESYVFIINPEFTIDYCSLIDRGIETFGDIIRYAVMAVNAFIKIKITDFNNKWTNFVIKNRQKYKRERPF